MLNNSSIDTGVHQNRADQPFRLYINVMVQKIAIPAIPSRCRGDYAARRDALLPLTPTIRGTLVATGIEARSPPDLSVALHDYPELAEVVAAWRHLPEHIRAAILSLVQVPRRTQSSAPASPGLRGGDG
jgi:hypothetical protein